MKGHPESNCGGGGGGGGVGWTKKKMAMVVVVMLVGLMGVIVVQKVKDRRLFNLVIKDKDRQILSLRLLLQRERQYAKENKRKNQDLNAKLYSLGAQKIELNNKIMEMRSTIDSMRDEQRVLELAIDEKQNQIKHKESEIKDLKINLQTPPKIWSVSTDDPSNRAVNLTNMVINPDVKVQKPKEELAGSKDDKDNAKIETHNTIDSEESGNGLSMIGRRFFIGASESQKNKNLTSKRSKSDGQDKGQLKANTHGGPPEVTLLKPRNYPTDEVHQEANKTRNEADRMDDNEADLDSSRNVLEADQDYKEETEE